MDSLTQITLGAAVGEATLGRQLGNRAILWGAVFGTLPDMDMVATPFQDSVQFLVHHRAASHSLLAIVVATPLFAWLFTRWYREHDPPISYRRWFAFFGLVFLTHVLLDCCTNYGTQIYWPFSDARVGWNNIFIIDPLYTLPFLACVIACMFFARTSGWRRAINYAGLIISTAYLALTFANKHHVNDVFAQSFEQQGIEINRMMTCPTPLNNLLWYCVAEAQDDVAGQGGYHIGFYSLLDADRDVEFQFVPRHDELWQDIKDTYPIERMIWFADGYYCLRPHAEGVVLHVMKFGKLNGNGAEELYPFTYLVRRRPNPGVTVERYNAPRETSLPELAENLWTRMLGE
ncbi:MAG: metal-dependent hydrolase [Pirellulales bacterium]|nr:metal-dependent hydrolase [Pirellulales bacterium]